MYSDVINMQIPYYQKLRELIFVIYWSKSYVNRNFWNETYNTNLKNIRRSH